MGLLKEGIASGHDLLRAQQRADLRPRREQQGRTNSFLSPTQHTGPKEFFGRLCAYRPDTEVWGESGLSSGCFLTCKCVMVMSCVEA